MVWTPNRTFLEYFCADESGQDLVEYALIAALMGLGCIVGLKNVTSGVTTVFNAAGSTLTSAV